MITKNEINAVRALSRTSERRQQRQFIVEGDKSVRDIVQNFPESVIEIFALASWTEQYPDIPATAIKSHELKQMSQLKTPNSVLAVLKQPEPLKLDRLAGRYLYLDGIQDPGNVGSMLRTAHWFGLDGVISDNQTADVFSPKVVQASMASIMSVPVVRIEGVAALPPLSIPFIAADSSGSTDIAMLDEFILAIGQEGRGLSDEVKSSVDSSIAIAHYGDAESLNAGVACGILLSKLR